MVLFVTVFSQLGHHNVILWLETYWVELACPLMKREGVLFDQQKDYVGNYGTCIDTSHIRLWLQWRLEKTKRKSWMDPTYCLSSPRDQLSPYTPMQQLSWSFQAAFMVPSCRAVRSAWAWAFSVQNFGIVQSRTG